MTGRPMNWARKRSQITVHDARLNRRAWAEYRAWEQSLNKYERRRLQLMDRYASGRAAFAKIGE